VPELTGREQQVLDRVCQGLSNKKLAQELGVSEQAVKAHITRLFLKYSVDNRAGLVAVVVGGAERVRVLRERDARNDELERRIDTLIARNEELERHLGTRPEQIVAAASAAD